MNRRILSPTITSAEVSPPSGPIVLRNLTGRLQLCEPKAKKAGPIHAVLHLSGGQDLRYVDQKKMGQVFVTRQPPDQAPIADYAGMGRTRWRFRARSSTRG